MYPAYPRHFFSLRGLVHICIPQTGTPCGRGLCHRSLTDSRGSHPLGLCFASLTVLTLYHTWWGLSRGFADFFCLRAGVEPALTNPPTSANRDPQTDKREEDLNLSGVVPWSFPARPWVSYLFCTYSIALRDAFVNP